MVLSEFFIDSFSGRTMALG